MPRGAVAVIAVGLVLSGLTALLTVGEDEGGERLDWERGAAIPDSKPSALGADGELQITDAGIESTRANASGYSLFRIDGTLVVDFASFRGRAEPLCTVRVPQRTVLARTPNKRASYPLPSEDLGSQAVPELSVVRFSAKGTDLVGVEIEDAFDEFTNAPAAKVEWAPYRQGQQTWEWVLEPTQRTEPVTLSFATLWRTTAEPGAAIECSVKAGGRRARVTTSGSVAGG